MYSYSTSTKKDIPVMKVLVLNVQRAKGVSAKNNREYDISTVTYCTPVENVSRENRQVTGYGFNASELGLDPSALPQFSKHEFPCELDLVIEPDPRNMNRNLCKGVN
jgi:hypothetical protein